MGNPDRKQKKQANRISLGGQFIDPVSLATVMAMQCFLMIATLTQAGRFCY
jgi:hypothetical protein